MGNIKPAQATLNALREGQVMNELAQAYFEATQAVKEHGKAATVTLTVTFKPLKDVARGLVDPPIVAVADVETKLPKQEPPSTLFYASDEGPTQQPPERQTGLNLTVASMGASDGNK